PESVVDQAAVDFIASAQQAAEPTEDHLAGFDLLPPARVQAAGQKSHHLAFIHCHPQSLWLVIRVIGVHQVREDAPVGEVVFHRIAEKSRIRGDGEYGKAI
ncbi:MAG: hypothetical protein H6Q37_1851, partial [Chloroflexi bacterium]|nr:hypothetical protein [Chloroflexota bacterium]